MSKTDIFNDLEADLSNPGSRKSGEYLEDRITVRLRQSLVHDRDGVVGALTDWLILRQEPQTMLAVRMAAKFRLGELRKPIEELGRDIEKGKAFLPFYKRWVDEALEAMS